MPKDTEELVSDSAIEVMYDSVTLAPGERGQIIFIPDSPLRRPSLFVSSLPETKKATIEQVFHGRTGLNVLKTSSPDGEEPLSGFKFGRLLDIAVTADEPVKVVVINRDNEKITVKASLVIRNKKED